MAGLGAWHLRGRELAARDLRAQLTETRLVAAELAGQRGQWAEALRLLDLAQPTEARHTVRVTMAKLRR